VDDVLYRDVDPAPIMAQINTEFRLKNDKIEVPKMYLGTYVKDWEYVDENGIDNHCWDLGAESYIKEAFRIIKKLMEKHNLSYSSTKRHDSKTSSSNLDYRPELDTTLY